MRVRVRVRVSRQEGQKEETDETPKGIYFGGWVQNREEEGEGKRKTSRRQNEEHTKKRRNIATKDFICSNDRARAVQCLVPKFSPFKKAEQVEQVAKRAIYTSYVIFTC